MVQSFGQDRFLTLLEAHKPIALKVAGLYCRDATDRDDLAQEIALQLWRSFKRYDEAQRFSTWMYRVALNVAISNYRKQQREPRLAELDERALSIVDANAANSGNSEARQRRLQELIDTLDELDRALIMLHLDDHSYEDIAAILGITPSNVGTKLNRVKLKLKRLGAERGE